MLLVVPSPYVYGQTVDCLGTQRMGNTIAKSYHEKEQPVLKDCESQGTYR